MADDSQLKADSPAEPSDAPPPDAGMEVPDYDGGGGMFGSNAWWEGMASLTLCGKKLSHEQAKQLFTGMVAAIVLLIVGLIVLAAGSGSDAPTGGSAPPLATYSAPAHDPSLPIGTHPTMRLNGKNSVCSESGCTGRIEILAPPVTDPAGRPEWGTVCGHWCVSVQLSSRLLRTSFSRTSF